MVGRQVSHFKAALQLRGDPTLWNPVPFLALLPGSKGCSSMLWYYFNPSCRQQGLQCQAVRQKEDKRGNILISFYL
jgi:hypothetical protein